MTIRSLIRDLVCAAAFLAYLGACAGGVLVFRAFL